jgi:hypothetical protein
MPRKALRISAQGFSVIPPLVPAQARWWEHSYASG